MNKTDRTLLIATIASIVATLIGIYVTVKIVTGEGA